MATPPPFDGDPDVDALYAQAPEDFIQAREELARRRKAQGRPEDAAAIKALRRPSVAAWAVNRVVRDRPAELDELLAAADELRRLQRRAVSGVRAEGFRRATDRRRRAVAALSRRADDILADGGRGSPGASAAVAATFEAASIDEEARAQVKAGRLTRELVASSGFGGLNALDVVPAPKGRRTKGGRPDHVDASDRSDHQRRERAAAEARRAAIKAHADAGRLTERATRLATEAARSRELADKAQEEATSAGAEAARAERAARRAEKQAER
jgi:hypothetical protein